MRISVGDKSLSRSAYGHFSPMPRRGPSHIAVRKNLPAKFYGRVKKDVDSMQEVMYHETGHAVDYWLWGTPRPYGSVRTYWSETQEFQAAWSKDRTAWLKKKGEFPGQSSAPPTLDYFGRPTPSATDGWYDLMTKVYTGYRGTDTLKKELVADLYAILHGADIRQGNIDSAKVLEEFPTIVALMRRKMKGKLKR
jgi:hypothetical protein